MAASLQPLDLLAQYHRIAAVPAVGDEQHHGAAVERAAPPALMELPKRLADARAAGPVGHRPRYVCHGLVEPADAQFARYARELGGKDERFDAAVPASDCVGEVPEQTRVAPHRAADLAQADDP